MSARTVKTGSTKIGKGNSRNSDRKFILRRAKNGRRREKTVSAAVYGMEKDELKKAAKLEGRKLGYRDMSVSAYINMKLLLP